MTLITWFSYEELTFANIVPSCDHVSSSIVTIGGLVYSVEFFFMNFLQVERNEHTERSC